MISVAEAIALVLQETTPLTAERVALDHALGRVLAEDVVADMDLPPFDRAQMDGYAVRSADLEKLPARLRIVGESAAGAGWRGGLRAGEAVRIMTGAPLPEGADSVQQVEVTRELDGGAEVEIERATSPGQFFAPRASEINRGETVLHAGQSLGAAQLAVLASFGYDHVMVGRRPRVAILATGTELVKVEERPGPDQIRDSNSYSLGAYAARAGALPERLPFAGDDRDYLAQLISQAAKSADVIVLSGGVSMGVYDFTKPALHSLGAQIFFERVALRPGKPTVFARLPGEHPCLVFGLPGNPVSVSVTFNLFARTAIQALQGAAHPQLKSEHAVLARPAKGGLERATYLPAQTRTDKSGRLVVEPLKWGGSSDFVAFAQADALLFVPLGVTMLEVDSIVEIIRLPA